MAGAEITPARGAPVGIVVTDAGGVITSANSTALHLLGRTGNDLVGTGLGRALNGDDARGQRLGAAVLAGASAHVEQDTFDRRDGSPLTVWWALDPLRDPRSGTATGAVLVFGDSSARPMGTRPAGVPLTAGVPLAAGAADRRHAELVATQGSIADLEWMAAITQALSSTLDEHEVIRRLARLVVGRFGGVAVADLIHGTVLERVVWAAADGVDLDLDGLLGDAAHVRFEASSATYRTISTDPVVHLSGPQLSDHTTLSPATLALFEAAGATDVLSVSMTARGRIVGVLGLMRLAGDRPFTALDETVAADLCQRAALAVDNARLYRAQADISSRLQRALLPQIPALPHLRAAVRYLTAKDRFDVGGDWYDVFACPPGSGVTVLVVGDVAGHDLAAGTTMSALRNLLRGVAVATERDPAHVLETVDSNLDPLGIRGTATALIMTVAPTDGGDWRLTWSNAGHMPPLLLLPSGRAELAEVVHGPLLGTGLNTSRGLGDRVVPAGTTLVLYTDGLVEARGESIDAGLQRLRQAATSLVAPIGEPDAVADELLARNHASTEDDTAMLVCHLPALSGHGQA